MKWFPVLLVLAAAGITTAHWMAFDYVPMEATMGAIQRIFYFHVPSAMLCYLGFGLCFAGSITYLYNRKARADAFALASAEVGLIFGLVVLVTGPLWARAAWGTWWKWEPRLTTMALLVLIFAAYWVLRTFGGRSDGVRRFAAVLAVFGAPNIFFVHIAVERWRGDHPPSVALEPEMKIALYTAMASLMVVFGLLTHLRYRAHVDALSVGMLRRRFARLGGR
jgi:heme exporter protein C